MGFKSFRSARALLSGIELMHMIRKGQSILSDLKGFSTASQFYVIAAQLRPV